MCIMYHVAAASVPSLRENLWQQNHHKSSCTRRTCLLWKSHAVCLATNSIAIHIRQRYLNKLTYIYEYNLYVYMYDEYCEILASQCHIIVRHSFRTARTGRE